MIKEALVSLAALALAGGCGKKDESNKSSTSGGGAGLKGAGSDLSAGSSSGGGSAAAATANAGSGSAAGSAADPALVERGAYLAGVMGCGFCHMPMGATGPDFARAFAGGLEVPEVFGTWRSPNITPHKGTGIGNWTDEQIIAAVREGIRPDGSQLYPIMPYLNYNRLTDADAKALVAFLRSVPPIENVVAPTKDLKLPKIPAPKPANTPDPVDDPAKHGEYLVTIMHCAMCHTPPGKDGVPDMSKMFAGGMEMELPPMGTGKLFTSNLTSDPETGLGKWSVEEIGKAVKTMTRPDGSIIQGPMQFYLGGWSKLEDQDVTAIATFIKAIPPIKNKVAKSTFKPHAGPPPGASGGGGGAPAATEGKTGAVDGAKTEDALKSAEPKPSKAAPTRRAVKKSEDPDAGGE